LQPEIQRRILVACRKEESGHPAIQAFIETIQDGVQALSPSLKKAPEFPL